MSEDWKNKDIQPYLKDKPANWSDTDNDWVAFKGNEKLEQELASIKQTQSKILEKLDGTIDTQLTGSIAELEIKRQSTVLGAYDVEAGRVSTRFDVEKANTAVLFIKNPDEDKNVFFARGEMAGGVKTEIPIIDSNLIARTDPVDKEGMYYIDASGLSNLLIQHRTLPVTATATIVLTTTICPKPLDAPVKYKRITPEDGVVTGKFRAIEPLTDIVLHSHTRLMNEYNLSTSLPRFDVIETGDERAAGQTLFGPFQRVRIESGAALLVLL